MAVLLFIKEKFVDPYIVAIDSTLLKAKGHVWHKSSMKIGKNMNRELCPSLKYVVPADIIILLTSQNAPDFQP